MRKVAVIMCVYCQDDAAQLKEAVNSILGQTHNETDLFIYRDGLVHPALEDYLIASEGFDSRISVYRSNSNHGLAYGLNFLIAKVLAKSECQFIARMDSDDVSRNKRISKQVVFFERNPEIDVCGTACREFGTEFAKPEKRLPETHAELVKFSMTRCPFVHPTVMFRISVFQEGNRYPTDTSLTEDMALWFLLLKNGYRFANINEILLDYRLTEGTLARRKGFSKALSEIKIRLKNMQALNQTNTKNVLLVLGRIGFHMLPAWALKLAYRYIR
jgi:hypothetical protein